MKVCSNCAASNVNASEFCTECGMALPEPSARRSTGTADTSPRRRGIRLPARATARAGRGTTRAPVDSRMLADTLELTFAEGRARAYGRRAALMFILDCTESMAGEIDAIRDTITSFVDTLQNAGLDIRVGLIEFRDRLINEEQRVLLFDGRPFTSNPEAFRREASLLSAVGGGDEPESSLDAVLLALRQPFDPEAQKILVLITDAPPHVPDKEASNVEQVAEAVRAANISQFYLVIPVEDAHNQVYLHLCSHTRGIAFDLGKGGGFRQRAEDFKRTLRSLCKTISAATV
jgi:Mg-chelatase subunit ChlD